MMVFSTSIPWKRGRASAPVTSVGLLFACQPDLAPDIDSETTHHLATNLQKTEAISPEE